MSKRLTSKKLNWLLEPIPMHVYINDLYAGIIDARTPLEEIERVVGPILVEDKIDLYHMDEKRP